LNHLFQADNVILSAGAIETPKLLIKAGLNAGKHLFVDTFVTVGAILQNIQFNKEVAMYSLFKGHDYILSPHYSSIIAEKLKPYGFKEEDIMGIMVKIKDDRSGIVSEDQVTKNNTSRDAGLLAEGSALAGAILTESGADAKTLVSTPARGAHPGGSAAIGETVNINLETDIKGLFVADASVFPSAPGAPPILTIIALAKRLVKYLSSQ
ncbi:MAG TPA: GMC oxidoreductase, partial [Methanobacterium sp.]|nr:GMC oxidoreductase [Methanobacterium sp.]